MNNQGLEALAALAAAAPAPTGIRNGSTNLDVAPKCESEQKSSEDTAMNSEATVTDATVTTGINLPAHLAYFQAQQTNPQLQQQTNPQLQQLRGLGQQFANLTSQELSLFGGGLQIPQRSDPSSVSMLQNASYQQWLLQSIYPQLAAQNETNGAVSNHAVSAAAAQLASLLGLGQEASSASTSHCGLGTSSQAKVHEHHSAQGACTSGASSAGNTASSSMAPPPAPTSPTGRSSAPTIQRATNPPSVSSQRSSRDSVADEEEGEEFHTDDKKEQKRAANRKSAQLSRKRKKQFIEELKDENDDLRRKEQILKSIPDLVVVFDSTGKLWFVSQSISRFIQFKSSDLEGKSFWDRLCSESVRLLKAAFMDSLAARESHTDTVPLGSGLWDLRLQDKDGSFVTVTLNGVVHFAGERPECVCCIRPKDNSTGSGPSQTPRAVNRQILVSSAGDTDVASSHHEGKPGKGRESTRISDSCNSSGESVSGNSDQC